MTGANYSRAVRRRAEFIRSIRKAAFEKLRSPALADARLHRAGDQIGRCDGAHPGTGRLYAGCQSRRLSPQRQFPAAFVAGMPIGLQVIAPPNQEALVLRVCRAFELAWPWVGRKPRALMEDGAMIEWRRVLSLVRQAALRRFNLGRTGIVRSDARAAAEWAERTAGSASGRFRPNSWSNPGRTNSLGLAGRDHVAVAGRESPDLFRHAIRRDEGRRRHQSRRSRRLLRLASSVNPAAARASPRSRSCV